MDLLYVIAVTTVLVENTVNIRKKNNVIPKERFIVMKKVILYTVFVIKVIVDFIVNILVNNIVVTKVIQYAVKTTNF